MFRTITCSIFSLLALNLTSFGQIQISGGGTDKLVFTVLQDITIRIDAGQAWGYIWGVKLNNSLTSADGIGTDAELVSGSGPGGVLLGGTAPQIWNYASNAYQTYSPSINSTLLATSYNGGPYSFVNNGVVLEFEFNGDFKLDVGSTFTLRQGSYERAWAGEGIPPEYQYIYPPNALIAPGTTYTITKDSFFSSSEQGSNLDTSKISLVPEPTSLSLLAVGFGFFALARRFKRS